MTDLAAQAAGRLTETAFSTAAKRAKKAVGKRLPGAANMATKTLSDAAKAPKRTAKSTTRKRRNAA